MKITIEFNSWLELQEFIDWQTTKRAVGKTPLQGSGMTHRTMQLLMGERIEFVEDALRMSDSELLRIKNFGRKSLNELRSMVVPNVEGEKIVL